MTTSEGGWGYPPMSTLEGAVPGWPKGAPLTAVDDPETARTVLAARAVTSVDDPMGLRRWWIADLVGLVIAMLIVGDSRIFWGSGSTGPSRPSCTSCR